MKRFVIILFIAVFLMPFAYSSEKKVANLTDFKTSLNISSFSSNEDVDGATTVSAGVVKALKVMDITHMILGGLSYIGFVTNDGIGFSLLYNAYKNPNYYTDPIKLGLQTAHKVIMVNAYIAYGLNAILGFVTLGLRLYYGLPINTFHVIVGLITTALYLFEIVSMSITKYAYEAGLPYRRELSLAHGMLSGTMTLAMTLTIIAVPVGYKHKKVWKLRLKSKS